MREKDEPQNLYRYSPPPTRGAPAPRAEEDIERYYQLVRVKLAPRKLRRISGINVVILLGAILALFLASFLLAKPSVSTLEKRDLAKLPAFSAESLFHGTLTRDIETWFADTFPMRDWFVGLSAVVSESRGVRIDDVRLIPPSGSDEAQDIPKGVDTKPPAPDTANQPPAVSGDDSSAPESSTPESEPAPPQNPVDEGAVGAISNGTFVYKGMAMSLYGGSRESAAWYADVLNTYRSELPGVQIYNMIIPTSIEFYVPNKYRDLTQSQKDTIDYVYGLLDSGIKKVDAYSKIAAHKDEYLYFRTDHHWTGLGAYYAYTAFCEQAGLTPINLSDSETRRLDNFIGTMYAQTQDTTLLQTPDYVDYYIFPQDYTAVRYGKDAPYYPIAHTLWGEYAQSPNSYSVFLHGDFPLIKVQTGNHNGRKIMVVKESFGNAFAPFLINHYEEVYIVDQRYFQLPAIDFIKANGISELVFANNTFAVCTPYHIRCIDGLRHQAAPYGAPAVPAAAPPPVTVPAEEAAPPASSAPEKEIPVIAPPPAPEEPIKVIPPTADPESSSIPHKAKPKKGGSSSGESFPEEMDDKERSAQENTPKKNAAVRRSDGDKDFV